MTTKFKTWTPGKEDLEAAGSDWYLVDATGQTLGRLASSVATILKGKHKPTYTPHQNMGDHVVVVNAAKVVVTGNKLDDKVYTRYSGYPSGLRTRTLRRQREMDPTVPVMHAVEGMLQRNRLGAQMLKRLRVYPGAEHGHQAQQPKAVTFTEKGEIKIG
jgi:large subunit ribosomal protein L13